MLQVARMAADTQNANSWNLVSWHTHLFACQSFRLVFSVLGLLFVVMITRMSQTSFRSPAPKPPCLGLVPCNLNSSNLALPTHDSLTIRMEPCEGDLAVSRC